MASGFSSIMKLTDLNDFIAPSLECVKPVTAAPASLVPSGRTVRGLIQLEDDFGVQGGAPAPPQKATINLSDCLACSGCVTSAEVVLVTQQSSQQLRSVLSERAVEVVVSMCPQAVLSLAHKHSLPPQECANRLAGYFRSLGATEVWDTNLARSIALLEAAQEVKEKLASSDPAALPVLASACPGWICYAEKTQTQKVLDHISRCRSPQQVMGALVNKVWAAKENKQLGKVYHVTLMPCYDKKLEASRLEFEDELTHSKDVDCVITAIEVEQMLQEDSTDLRCVPPSPLSLLLSAGELLSHAGSSAGGYADFVLRYVAETLYNTDIGNIQWRTMKNADLQEASLEVGGEEVFLVCRAYGFRNLQNIVQKLKRGKSQYHYVEVMACPSGCLNGGAQVRPEPGTSAKDLVAVLEGLYNTLPRVDPRADSVALEVLDQLQDSQPHIARTSYKLIEKNVTSLTIKW